MMKLSIAILATATVAATPATAAVVVPAAQTSTEGNSAASSLFGQINVSRYQQVFSAAEFGVAPVLLSGVTFRTNGLSTGALFEGAGSAFTRTITGSFNLSTTGSAVDGLSNAFAANRGADALDVIGRRSITYSSTAMADGAARAFDVVFNFDTPFLYNPLLGNLLLDVANFSGGSVTSSNGTPLDAQNTLGDSVSSLYVTNSTTANGVLSTKGYIAQFDATAVSPIPEPASWAMMLLGFGAVGYSVRRRRATMRPALAS